MSVPYWLKASTIGVAAIASISHAAFAAPVPALQADTFVDSIGVNTKLSYTDTPYGDYPKLKEMLAESKIRHIREGLYNDPVMAAHENDLATSLGIHCTIIVGGDLAKTGDVGKELIRRLSMVRPSVEMLEGPNEPDAGFTYNGKQFPESIITYQKLIYSAEKSSDFAAIPFLVPSISFPPKSSQVPNIPGDYANIHSYHGGRNPETSAANLDLANFYLKNAQIEAPGKPVICTETGNPNTAFDDPSLWMPRVSEIAEAKYALRTYLEYFRVGIKRTFIHEFIDEHPNPKASEQNFGLLRNDWSPKPVFNGIKNLITILADPGPAFKTTPLDYDLTGDTADVHQLLLQKRDGSYYLVLWHAVPSYNTDAKIDTESEAAHVTLDFHSKVSAVQAYEPLAWSTPGTAVDASSPLKLDVPDQPIVLSIVKAGAHLVVSKVGTDKAPVAGTPVHLTATVTNVGVGPTPAGVIVSVTFFDNSGGSHKMLTYSSTVLGPIAAGQSVAEASDGTWTPASGNHEIAAQVDDVHRVPETDRSKDTMTVTLAVP
jgi:hypothetical protein